jgi:hypothetical protein
MVHDTGAHEVLVNCLPSLFLQWMKGTVVEATRGVGTRARALLASPRRIASRTLAAPTLATMGRPVSQTTVEGATTSASEVSDSALLLSSALLLRYIASCSVAIHNTQQLAGESKAI